MRTRAMLVSEEVILEAKFFLNKLKSQLPGPEFTYFLKAFQKCRKYCAKRDGKYQKSDGDQLPHA